MQIAASDMQYCPCVAGSTTLFNKHEHFTKVLNYFPIRLIQDLMPKSNLSTQERVISMLSS